MRKRLFSFFIIILFLGVVITGTLSYNSTRKIVLKNLKKSLREECNLSADYIIFKGNTSDFDSIANDISKKLNKRVTIIRDDGKVMGESLYAHQYLDNHLGRPEIRDALKFGEGVSTRYSNTEKTLKFYYAKKFEASGQIFIVRLAMELNDIKDMQGSYLRLILIAMFVGVVVCSLLAFVYLNKITKPIRQLTSVATTISLGDYERRINITSNDEIGQLGHAFNIMAGRLEETIVDLSDKRTKLISILKSMDDGVIVVDNNEKVLLINPAAQKLFNIGENVAGKHFIEVIRSYDIEDIIRNIPDEDTEITITYPVTKYLRIKATKVTNYDSNKESIGVMLFIQDITKIKSLEKMRSDFVANVSHELKTPLTSIKGFSETLKYVEDKETRDKFLDIIYVESERLTRLINDILSLSELENKNISLNLEKIDVFDTLDEVFHIMEYAAKEKNIDLEMNCQEDSLFINGDRDKFKQMIINLVDNAIKYTNPHGKVLIKGEGENGKVKISISDNGIGIPEVHIPRLFERFYRVDKARSRDAGGTGLGLAIVKHIVMLLNGDIQVKSKVGEGTTFTIYLPVINSELT
ncbi:histidine kinase [Fervidicella metallireducens AeB]|uniref:histidine kinase n=1 Tax=Fervidicella metallireducens AeB TaxID=1403537 RepID=A0A017RWV8_9CLOT|nr:ATP-binding protein [Fervidicella metallireducens]EYE88420.1 histidine kinase [Fervidicella metallireducens AeB]